jgi:hypothetical protein
MNANDFYSLDTNFLNAFYVYFSQAIDATEYAYHSPITNINEIIRTMNDPKTQYYPFLVQLFLKRNYRQIAIILKDSSYEIYYQDTLIMQKCAYNYEPFCESLFEDFNRKGYISCFDLYGKVVLNQPFKDFRTILNDTLKAYLSIGYTKSHLSDTSYFSSCAFFKYDVLLGLDIECISNEQKQHTPYTRALEKLSSKYCQKHKLSRIYFVSLLLDAP